MEGHATAAARKTEMEQSLAEALAQSEQAGEAVRSHSAQSAAAAAAALAAHTSSLRENLTGSHKALIQAASQVKEVTCSGESLASPFIAVHHHQNYPSILTLLPAQEGYAVMMTHLLKCMSSCTSL